MEDQTLQAVPAAEAPAEETAAGCPCRHKHREAPEYDSLIRRLNPDREGQVRGVRGMVEKECYCTDILTQVSAIQSALNAFSRELLSNHIHSCVECRTSKTDIWRSWTTFWSPFKTDEMKGTQYDYDFCP